MEGRYTTNEARGDIKEGKRKLGGRTVPRLEGDIIALDVETDGLDPYQGTRIFCWSYFTNKGEYGFMRKTPEGLEWIANLFADPTKQIVFQNGKFDLKMFLVEGIDVFGMKAKTHCTLILSKLFNGMLWSYKLKDLAIRFLGRSTQEKTEITDWLKANSRAFNREHGRSPNFSDAPIELVKQRAIWDTETTLLLFHYFYPKVMKICPELYETERQLQLVVVDMENTGVQVDITRAKLLRAQAKAGINRIQNDLNELVLPLTVRRAHCSVRGCKKNKKTGIKVIFNDDDIPDKCPICCGEVEIREQLITKETLDEEDEEPDEKALKKAKRQGTAGLNTNSAAIHLPTAFIKLGIPLKYKTKPKKGKKGKKATGGGNWCFDEYAMIRYVSPVLARVIRDSGEEGWPSDKFYDGVFRVVNEYNLDRKELLPPLILKIRELGKMVSTYYDNIIENAVDVHTEPSGREVGILHCSFNQSEAMSGRFSSSEPNMQNMPRILGPRECFIARKGRRNWHIDYSQVEMKLFVHFAKDKKMAEAIKTDIHLYVASQIYGIPPEMVTKEQRKRAKGVGFAIIYGSGPPTMAETLTKKGLVTLPREAAILISNYHRKFPSVRRTTNTLKVELSRNGYVTNPHGRRYHIDDDKGYTALNYMCQGESADIMKKAMVDVWKFLRAGGYKSRLLKTIHDEIEIEVPQCEEQVVIPAIIKIMEDHENYFIPITVEAEVSTRWSEKKKPKEMGIKWCEMN